MLVSQCISACSRNQLLSSGFSFVLLTIPSSLVIQLGPVGTSGFLPLLQCTVLPCESASYWTVAAVRRCCSATLGLIVSNVQLVTV